MNVATMLSRLGNRSKGRWTDAQKYQFLNEAQELLIGKLNPIYLTEITEISSPKTMTGKVFDLSTLSPAIFSDDSVIALSSDDIVLRTDGYLKSVSVFDGGTNYLAGDLVFTGGGGSGAIGTYSVAAGVIDATVLTDQGIGYDSVPVVTTDPMKSLTWDWSLIDASVPGLTENFISICRIGNYLYCASWEGGGSSAKIYYFSYNSGAIVYEGNIAVLDAKSVATDGTTLFVGCYGYYLRAYSINPATGLPTWVTHVSANGEGYIVSDGNIIFRGYGAGIRSFNWSGAIFNPVDTETAPADTVVGLGISDSYLCAVDRGGGTGYLYVYTRVGGAMTYVTSVALASDTAQQCATDGTYFYVTLAGGGVAAYSLSGATLTLEDTRDDGGSYVGVIAYGGHIYCANAAASHGVLMYYFDGTTIHAADNGSFPTSTQNAHSLYADADAIYAAKTSGGMAAYSLPAEGGSAILQANMAGLCPFYTKTPINKIKEFTEKSSLAPTDENPRFYTFAGNLYALQPETDPRVTIYYIREPVEIASGVDCELDESLHELVVTMAESIGWQMDEQPPRARMALKIVDAIVKRMNERVA